MARDVRTLVGDALGWYPDRIQTLVEVDGRSVYELDGACGADGADGAVIAKFDELPARIALQVDALRMIAAAGVPVAALLAVELDPPAFFVMAKVVGVPLSSSMPAAARAAGTHLGTLHRLADSAPGPPPPAGWGALVCSAVDRHLAYLHHAGVLTTGEGRHVATHFRAIEAQLDCRPQSLLHGDLLPGHVLVDPDAGIVRAFIDFGDVQRGDAGLDLAVLTLEDEALLTPVLEGYACGPTDGDDALAMLDVYRLFCHLGTAHRRHAFGLPIGDVLRRIRASLGEHR